MFGIGIGLGVVVAALILVPKLSSPVDEARRVLGLRPWPEDEGWYTFRMNGKAIGSIYRTYSLPSSNKMRSEQLTDYLGNTLEPIGWKRSKSPYAHYRGFERWTKGDTTLGYAFDPDKPDLFCIELERRQSFWEDLARRLGR